MYEVERQPRSHSGRRRIALLALLVLVPLLHGAGAHLSGAAVEGIGAAAPITSGDFHAADEICALCSATRQNHDVAGHPVGLALAEDHAPDRISSASPIAHVSTARRPEAARAPPLASS